MSYNAILLIGLALGALLLLAGLFRPFVGLLAFLIIHFVQPGELVPALAPFRIELVYGTLLIGILIYRRAKAPGPSVLSDRILFSAVLLVGVGILSIPFAVWPGGAASTVLEMLKLTTLLFLLTLMLDSVRRLRHALWCMTGVAIWFAGSSLSAYAHGQFYALGKLDRAEGVNSMAGGPNELAGLLLALLPLLVALLRSSRNVLARTLLVVCGAVCLAAISLTGARIVMIALISIAIFYTIQSKHKVPTFLTCVLIAAMIWHFLPLEYKQRYLTVQQYAGGGQLDASNSFRLEIWKAGEQIFFKYPILGVGAGQFPTAYGLIYLNGAHRAWMNPHNLVIQVACELGVVGLLVFGYFVWQIIRGIAVGLRRKRERGMALNYQVAIACAVMFVGVMILSFVSHTLYRPYWFVLAGLAAANRNIIYAKLRKRVKLQSRTSEVSDDLAEDAADVEVVNAVSTSSDPGFGDALFIDDRIRIAEDRS
jgi:putative inorganic carbon (hco3(-)) transporter